MLTTTCKFLKSRYCSGVVVMLAEITGSLRATNVKRQYYPWYRHYTPYSPSRTVHIVGGEHVMSDEKSDTCDYPSVVHYIIGSRDDDYVFSHDAMSQWTCIDAGCRTLFRVNIEYRTLHAEHEHWTRTMNFKQWTRNMNCETEQPWYRQECANSVVFFCFLFAYSDVRNCTEYRNLTILLVA